MNLPIANVSADLPDTPAPPQLVYALAFAQALIEQMRRTDGWDTTASLVRYERLDHAGTPVGRVSWPGSFTEADAALQLSTTVQYVFPSYPRPTLTPILDVGFVVRTARVMVFVCQAHDNYPGAPCAIAAFVPTEV